jgi:hypothetical protein
MALRVISTKLSEEEHNRLMELCEDSQCNLSTFLKQCLMELIEKEQKQIEKPVEVSSTPDFSMIDELSTTTENKIAPKIRYQYF